MGLVRPKMDSRTCYIERASEKNDTNYLTLVYTLPVSVCNNFLATSGRKLNPYPSQDRSGTYLSPGRDRQDFFDKTFPKCPGKDKINNETFAEYLVRAICPIRINATPREEL